MWCSSCTEIHVKHVYYQWLGCVCPTVSSLHYTNITQMPPRVTTSWISVQNKINLHIKSRTAVLLCVVHAKQGALYYPARIHVNHRDSCKGINSIFVRLLIALQSLVEEGIDRIIPLSPHNVQRMGMNQFRFISIWCTLWGQIVGWFLPYHLATSMEPCLYEALRGN